MSEIVKKEIRVQPICSGTVIDHITAGQALNVLKILGITGTSWGIVSILINAPSSYGKKDVVKIEGRELVSSEVDKISLISPGATINIIRDYDVQEKNQVGIPSHVEGVVKCINPNCISNSNEPIESKFDVDAGEGKIELRCGYCERVICENIADHLL
ncbi:MULTISPECIES: aspartate carbamoyltransferase regulatory subunit [Methanohalophilus]|uniref:Aspartate carbamoyltransferase regulatory chain n=2 Tax=Methanohalophilus portucalensis TaxID=39664 RepID=A0A1L9C400_9EURY|nr:MULTISPECIES: aspartate carbamoyltransferase regulatory subunit [Methanohalophilus]ATU07951.1 aspartate carbamoyltransferase regulatory subunit [Methanohalophilus portucalensis]OJH49207.1 aspartate carbamoyltransferase, regulatory subunit [Methanohalophilus portucalensis FDF-1]RNI11668.1 aspartate carbamoyltransferase regulatory subunit [Methanohalophilus portucalensis FDF-1]SMH42483.1 aspartate carbamoyltransferase regulatory subunit [Methanohalophilus portucalensis FDF-1]